MILTESLDNPNTIITVVAIDRANTRHMSDVVETVVKIDYPEIFMKILAHYVDKAISEYHNITNDITKVEDLN